ncbi:MAG: hypothetical protein BWK79_03375 [Beggiatoa sp. IS2]|nr:MAG: hypothetical protein BWK79_03375 [Beggiatoa sp. IS2]
MPTKTIKVPNINCGHCTRTIEKELKDLPGVTQVAAEVANKTVTVTWNEPPSNWNNIASLLKEIGYPATN